MRCPACQVDLNENVRCCPLCGGPAEDTPPLIPGISYQDYPVYAQKRSRRRRLSPWSFLPETAFALALLLIFAARKHGISIAAVLASAVAALTLVTALVLSALLRRYRERCLAALLLLIPLGAAACGAALAVGGGAALGLPACALGLSLLLLSALRGLYGKRLREELKARFLF